MKESDSLVDAKGIGWGLKTSPKVWAPKGPYILFGNPKGSLSHYKAIGYNQKHIPINYNLQYDNVSCTHLTYAQYYRLEILSLVGLLKLNNIILFL